MNNVTHATDWRNPRKHVWEIYNYYSQLGEPAYRIKMSRLLWDCDLTRVYCVSDSRWVGIVTRTSLNRRIKIVLSSVDVAILERTLGRKLVHGEVFSEPINLTCVRYEGLTLYGIDSANIGNGVVRRETVAAIVPYGMFAPVTYAPPQPVISAPLADPRKLLAGETVELVRAVFAPMGYKDSWRAVGMFEGKEVHFRIYGEHAKLLKQAGHAPLAKGSMQIPHIDVVLEWSERYNDLRLAGVFASDGTLHKLVLPVAAPVSTEDNRTEIQKKLGIGNRYSGFDFGLKPKKAS